MNSPDTRDTAPRRAAASSGLAPVVIVLVAVLAVVFIATSYFELEQHTFPHERGPERIGSASEVAIWLAERVALLGAETMAELEVGPQCHEPRAKSGTMP